MLVVGIIIAWWKDRSAFDQRLQKLEQMYAPTREALWGAADILGAPDDPTGGAGKSWCPSGTSAADWVEVGFDRAVPAATIDLYETYLVGCVAGRTDEGMGLSEDVSRAVPAAVEAVRTLVTARITNADAAPASAAPDEAG